MPNVLIAGASRGIGLGLAARYLDLGHTVYALLRNPGAAAELNDLARQHPDRLKLIEADITASDVLPRIEASLGGARLQRLIVNAGISQPTVSNLFELTDEQTARLFTTNAIAPIRLAQGLADRLEDGGVAAFMSSQMGSVGLALSARIPLYGASKAALNSMMQSWVAQQGELRFSVLALHPGWVRTDMGGSGADISVDESVQGLVDTIEGYAGEQARCAFVDYQDRTLAW